VFVSRTRYADVGDSDRAIDLLPHYAIAYQNRGRAYSSIGDRERAIRDLKKALQMSHDLDPGSKQFVEALLAKLERNAIDWLFDVCYRVCQWWEQL